MSAVPRFRTPLPIIGSSISSLTLIANNEILLLELAWRRASRGMALAGCEVLRNQSSEFRCRRIAGRDLHCQQYCCSCCSEFAMIGCATRMHLHCINCSMMMELHLEITPLPTRNTTRSAGMAPVIDALQTVQLAEYFNIHPLRRTPMPFIGDALALLQATGLRGVSSTRE